MDHSRVSLFWDQPAAVDGFSTAVCLHGHTMHSEECLSFLPRYLHGVPGISRIVRGYQRGPRPAVDFSRAYWTPPLTPASALRLERRQIANLSLRPLVSLTDHDNIDAGLALEDEPISVEWTVPYERSMLHLGIHNLPPHSARSVDVLDGRSYRGAGRKLAAGDSGRAGPDSRRPDRSQPPVLAGGRCGASRSRACPRPGFAPVEPPVFTPSS